MADEQFTKLLEQGVDAWNKWRKEHPDIKPDLSGINLRGDDKSGKSTYGPPRGPEFAVWTKGNFEGVDFSYTNLTKAKLYNINFSHGNFHRAYLDEADLEDSFLYKADLSYTFMHNANAVGAYLAEANVSWARSHHAQWDNAMLAGADLTRTIMVNCSLSNTALNDAILYRTSILSSRLDGADFRGASFFGTSLSNCDLSRAKFNNTSAAGVDLEGASLIKTDFEGADISGSRVYGISAWDLKFDDSTKMNDLVITEEWQPKITVDDLEVAQFIYLLLNNAKVRDVIDTVTSKVILILGRFTDERLAVLEAIREELRNRNFTPVIFDFDKPASKDVTGTVETLARMSRFIIADLTDPSSIPHELATIVPFLRTTPVLPIRLEGSGGYSMFDDLWHSYAWVLEPHNYKDGETLISTLPEVIGPADKMAENFRKQS